MSVDTVSPILNSMDYLATILKRARNKDSDYTDQFDSNNQNHRLEFIDHNTKRLKVEKSALSFCDARLGYLLPNKGLGLSDDFIDQMRIKNTNNLLLNKKLHLVLDLDHTLLNSSYFDKLSPEEEYLKSTQSQADHHSLQHVHVVDVRGKKMVTKLRPYIRSFLWEACKLFEITIYTMGNREYALEMAKLLDPFNHIFGGRVVSRNDSTKPDRKSLDVLLARESAVVILDDTKQVWENDDQENVIVMPRYHFFRSSVQQFGLISNSLPFSELKTDECDRYGGAYLADVLQLLRDIHTIFFNDVDHQPCDVMERDVRLVIPKKQVLKGCKIVFSRVFPSTFKAETHPLWKMAERLGATCSTEADASVTHVVAANSETQKSLWAVSEGKFLVNPQWIYNANLMWQRPPEDSFPCIR